MNHRMARGIARCNARWITCLISPQIVLIVTLDDGFPNSLIARWRDGLLVGVLVGVPIGLLVGLRSFLTLVVSFAGGSLAG